MLQMQYKGSTLGAEKCWGQKVDAVFKYKFFYSLNCTVLQYSLVLEAMTRWIATLPCILKFQTVSLFPQHMCACSKRP